MKLLLPLTIGLAFLASVACTHAQATKEALPLKIVMLYDGKTEVPTRDQVASGTNAIIQIEFKMERGQKFANPAIQLHLASVVGDDTKFGVATVQALKSWNKGETTGAVIPMDAKLKGGVLTLTGGPALAALVNSWATDPTSNKGVQVRVIKESKAGMAVWASTKGAQAPRIIEAGN